MFFSAAKFCAIFILVYFALVALFFMSPGIVGAYQIYASGDGKKIFEAVCNALDEIFLAPWFDQFALPEDDLPRHRKLSLGIETISKRVRQPIFVVVENQTTPRTWVKIRYDYLL